MYKKVHNKLKLQMLHTSKFYFYNFFFSPQIYTKQTNKNPYTPPNNAPDNILKNMGPGIAKDCKL